MSKTEERLIELAMAVVDRYGDDAVALLENWADSKIQAAEGLSPDLRARLADEADQTLETILSGAEPMRGLALDILIDKGTDSRSSAQRFLRDAVQPDYLDLQDDTPEDFGTLPDGTPIDEESAAEVLRNLKRWDMDAMLRQDAEKGADGVPLTDESVRATLEAESRVMVPKFPEAFEEAAD